MFVCSSTYESAPFYSRQKETLLIIIIIIIIIIISIIIIIIMRGTVAVSCVKTSFKKNCLHNHRSGNTISPINKIQKISLSNTVLLSAGEGEKGKDVLLCMCGSGARFLCRQQSNRESAQLSNSLEREVLRGQLLYSSSILFKECLTRDYHLLVYFTYQFPESPIGAISNFYKNSRIYVKG